MFYHVLLHTIFFFFFPSQSLLAQRTPTYSLITCAAPCRHKARQRTDKKAGTKCGNAKSNELCTAQASRNRGAGGAWSSATRGSDYAHHITIPPPPDFQAFRQPGCTCKVTFRTRKKQTKQQQKFCCVLPPQFHFYCYLLCLVAYSTLCDNLKRRSGSGNIAGVCKCPTLFLLLSSKDQPYSKKM